ncbi:MAG: cellulose biosynthesis protein BcsG [Desulfobulbaceae bacterium]|nr:cellulose biosynthesis protein BcsG [Desulfobulbaceae bacterium]
MTIQKKTIDQTGITDSNIVPQVSHPPIRLGAWNFYFLAKFLLYWKELIGFHPIENLAFAAILLAPLQSSFWRWIRTILATPVAIALLYHDSWLPKFGRLISEGALLRSFNFHYLIELAGRFISWPVVALLCILWAGNQILGRWIRVGVFVVGALIALTISQEPNNRPLSMAAAPTGINDADIPHSAPVSEVEIDRDSILQDFFSRESKRIVTFTTPAQDAPPFDIIFLHICSLAWDDVLAMGLQDHPLWQKFDISLSRFNSASSYSGPAAIRLLRAPCGQVRHAGLYTPGQEDCYLMPSLEKIGFEPNLVLNHDGHFDDFLNTTQKKGHLPVPPMPLTKLPVTQHSFDGSPIFDDLAVLSQWLDLRQKDPAARVAVFYNTISLHDGNRISGAKASLNSLETYKERLTELLDELDSFTQRLEQSGRRTLLIMVPEHGAAVRGDKIQIAGLREVPSPAITLVPVGFKIIGPGVKRLGANVTVDTPTSFLAISYIIAKMLEISPYAEKGFNASDYINGLPSTSFVSENEDLTVMGMEKRFYLRQGKDEWSEYPASSR